MKSKLKRLLQVVAPLPVCLMILVISALPAFAFSQNFSAGTYVLAEVMEEPTSSFLVNVNFGSGGVDYKGIIFRMADPSFQYAGLYFITSSGAEYRVAYWIGADTYWIDYEKRVLVFPSDFVIENSTFYAWFIVNSSKAQHGGTSGKFPDYSESQDIQDALDRLEGIDDEYNKLPEPEFWDDWYGAAIFQTDAYESYLTVLDVLYADSLITNIITVACPLNRVWDKIREQSDIYIMCNWCRVLFGKLVIEKVTIYEKYEAAVDRVPPYKLPRLRLNADRRCNIAMEKQRYRVQHGDIKVRTLIYLNKSSYDTRIFKSILEGSEQSAETEE